MSTLLSLLRRASLLLRPAASFSMTFSGCMRSLNGLYSHPRNVLELQEYYEAIMVGPNESIKKILAEVLAGMPDAVREIFILKKFIDLTDEEIAYVCDIPIRKVETRYNSVLLELGRKSVEGICVTIRKGDRTNG